MRIKHHFRDIAGQVENGEVHYKFRRQACCSICHSKNQLERHHVFYGDKRSIAEKYNMTVWVCHDCHRGPNGIHFNEPLDLSLKQAFQRKFEKDYSHDEFIKEFEVNCL